MTHKNLINLVTLKKIPLKIWTLRSQIEAIIQALKENGVNKIPYENLYELVNSINEELLIRDHFPELKSNLNLNQFIDQLDANVISENNEKPDQDEGKNNKVDFFKLAKKTIKNRINYTEGSTFLCDINFKKISFFTKKPFIIGQSIIIELEIPRTFSITAKVSHSKKYYPYSRVISNYLPHYRLSANFINLRKGERTLLRNFLKSITPEKNKKEKNNQNIQETDLKKDKPTE